MSSGAVRAEKERGGQLEVFVVDAGNHQSPVTDPLWALGLARALAFAHRNNVISGSLARWRCVLVVPLGVMADTIDVIVRFWFASNALCSEGTQASRHVLLQIGSLERNRRTPPPRVHCFSSQPRSAAQRSAAPQPWLPHKRRSATSWERGSWVALPCRKRAAMGGC